MITINGTVTLKCDKPLTDEETAQKVLEAEQYLNNEVATELYLRTGFGLRVHLG